MIIEYIKNNLKKNKPFLKYWIKASLIGIGTYILVTIYYRFSGDTTSGSRLVSQITADVGIILVCFSFLLSGISFFWDFLDKQLILRKYLGIIGFYFVLIHFFIALNFALGNPTIALSSAPKVISFFCATVSFAIFLQMLVISPINVTKAMGPKAVRILFRLGYLGLALGTIHYILREVPTWFDWLLDFEFVLPPFSFPLTFIVGYTFWLRYKLYVETHSEQEEKTQAPIPTSTLQTSSEVGKPIKVKEETKEEEEIPEPEKKAATEKRPKAKKKVTTKVKKIPKTKSRKVKTKE